MKWAADQLDRGQQKPWLSAASEAGAQTAVFQRPASARGRQSDRNCVDMRQPAVKMVRQPTDVTGEAGQPFDLF